MIRPLLFSIGTLCVLLGFVGIFLPLLPTTPFLLLAATCYAKSSQKFYNWLTNHRWFGEYIHSFRSKEGVPIRIKIKAVVVLWLTILLSAFFMGWRLISLTILLLCGFCVTLYLVKLPTRR